MLGYSAKAIAHRLETGRLHPIFRGVYAVGRREVTQEGIWMAAVLACGEGALLSHESAAQLWGIRARRASAVEVSVPKPREVRRRGIRAYKRALGPAMLDAQRGIPVTTPTQTLIDLAPRLTEAELDRAVNEADKLNLVRADTLSEVSKGTRGASSLREHLANQAFALTDSELERRFAKIARQTGLEEPETQVTIQGHRVDFLFRETRLVVETDGLTYHRTPIQQRRDRERDQDLTAAGLTVLRFTHHQIAHEPARVADILGRVESVR